MLALIAHLSLKAFALSDDPRLEKDDVRACVENTKRFLRSSEYGGEKNEQVVIGACRDADPHCVSEAGESLHPSEMMKLADFVKVIKACRGRGMGQCFSSMKDKVASYDRREVEQVLALLKRCD